MAKFKAVDVFQQTGFPENTYVEREEYDLMFKSSLAEGGVPIYLFGDSKTGKTSLWKKHIPTSSVVEIKVTDSMTQDTFFNEIVNVIDPFLKDEYNTTEQTSSNSTVNGKLGVKIASVGSDISATESNAQTSHYIRASNPGLTLTTVSAIVSKSKKIIILEDFQTASNKFVADISNVLKAFADDNIKVIIVGINNRVSEIQKTRPDIAGRIQSLNLSQFKRDALQQLIEKGQRCLNIEIDKRVQDFLINESFERAYILQGLCRYLCLILKIEETSKKSITITEIDNAERACKTMGNSLNGSYEGTAKRIATAATKGNKNDTYRLFLKVLKTGIKISNHGITASELATEIRKISPDYAPSAIYPCLPNLIKKQECEVFNYCEKRLYLSDVLFQFYIRWSDFLDTELCDS